MSLNNFGFVYSDAGRSKYFNFSSGDCVLRSICLAENFDYKYLYDVLTFHVLNNKITPVDNGISHSEIEIFLNTLGYFHFYFDKPTRFDLCNFPKSCIINFEDHFSFLKDNLIYDVYLPSSDWIVLGYFKKDLNYV